MSLVKFNRLTRDPNIRFHSVTVKNNVAEAIGVLEGWAETLMFFKIVERTCGDTKQLLLGHRCGILDSPFCNARVPSA